MEISFVLPSTVWKRVLLLWTFLTVKSELCKRRFCCSSSQMIVHCFEILHLCTAPAGSPARPQGADSFPGAQIKIRWIFFHVSIHFWASLVWRFLFLISLSISLISASLITLEMFDKWATQWCCACSGYAFLQPVGGRLDKNSMRCK